MSEIFAELLSKDRENYRKTFDIECSEETRQNFNTDFSLTITNQPQSTKKITSKSMYSSRKDQEPIMYTKPENIISSKPSTE